MYEFQQQQQQIGTKGQPLAHGLDHNIHSMLDASADIRAVRGIQEVLRFRSINKNEKPYISKCTYVCVARIP